MAKPKKAPSPAMAAVAAARAAVEQLAQKLYEAHADVKRLEAEVGTAQQALREAMVAADADLPQCRMVSVRWRSGKEEPFGQAVILRKTPRGILVTRHVGNEGGAEYRFKWSEWGSKFVQAEKSSSWVSDTRELRDVPEAFLPAGIQAPGATPE